MSTAGKVATHAARAAGFEVEIYCALEACNDAEVASRWRGAAERLQRAHAEAGACRVDCDWFPHAAGLLDERGRLKETEQAPRLPLPPLPHTDRRRQRPRPGAQARNRGRDATVPAGGNASVWRQRPDYVSTGYRLPELRDALLDLELPQVRSLPSSPWPVAGRPYDYAVPQACVDGAHTDIEALLTEPAADHYSAQLAHLPSLYNATGRYFRSPEVMLDLHMRSSLRRFRYLLHPGWLLFRCSPLCFGAAQPCRRLGPSPYPPTLDGTQDVTCGKPSVN